MKRNPRETTVHGAAAGGDRERGTRWREAGCQGQEEGRQGEGGLGHRVLGVHRARRRRARRRRGDGRRHNAAVIAVIDAAGQWPAERKFITFYYWLPFNFRFLAQQPPNKVESFLPLDSDPLT